MKYYEHLHSTLAQGLNYLALPHDCTTSVQTGGIQREDAEELPPFLLLDSRITSQDCFFKNMMGHKSQQRTKQLVPPRYAYSTWAEASTNMGLQEHPFRHLRITTHSSLTLL